MLTIYGVYRSRATRVLWLAGELGLPFNHVPVIQVGRVRNPNAPDAPLHSRSPAFLAINPNGHIPSIDDDGLILHESLAITLYLAKKHGGPLAPASLAEQGQTAMWTLWAANEIEASALQVMQLRAGDPKAAQVAIDKLRAPFAVLDQHLAACGGWLVGGRFTVADVNLAECLRYAQSAPELFDKFPRVRTWIEACQARPAFKAMWARREAEPA